MFYVPDISMTATFHLRFGLVDGLTETVVDFFVNAVFVLIPD